MTYALVLMAAVLTTQAAPPKTLDAPIKEAGTPAALPERAPDAQTSAPGTTAPLPAANATVEASKPSTPAKRKITRFGVMLDAGFPDALGVSFLYRPIRFVRLQAGAITTTSAFGLRGGVALVPFHFWVTPSLTLEAGRMFDGSTGFLRTFGLASATEFSDRIVQRFSYSFVNTHLGLELGSPNYFSFYIKAGWSYMDMQLNDFQDRFREAVNDTSITAQPARVRYGGPSAKLGFVFYFM